jgi:hypothetical protein
MLGILHYLRYISRAQVSEVGYTPALGTRDFLEFQQANAGTAS